MNLHQLLNKAQRVTDSVTQPEQAKAAIKYVKLAATVVMRDSRRHQLSPGLSPSPIAHNEAINLLHTMARRLNKYREYHEQLLIHQAISERRQARVH